MIAKERSATEVSGPRLTRFRIGRRALVAVIGVLAGAIATLLVVSMAFAAKNPTVGSLKIATVHSTRAAIYVRSGNSGESDASYTWEYITVKALKEGGSWTVAVSGSIPPATATPGLEVRHLTPGTPYDVRVKVKNESGSAEGTIELVTLATAAPEIYGCPEGSVLIGITTVGCTFRFVEGGSSAEWGGSAQLGAYRADYKADIESNGAETKYRYEYAESESGPFTPVPGAAGTITVAEDFALPEARLEGLAPSRMYYIRLIVESECEAVAKPGHICTVSETEHFETLSPLPFVALLSPENVTGASVHLTLEASPRSAETHWAVEYITAQAFKEGGSWTVGPGGTITSAEATEGSLAFAVDLPALAPSTVYHVRASAENEHGRTVSDERQFETAGAPSANTFPVHAMHGEVVRALGSVFTHGAGPGFDARYHFEYLSQAQFVAEGEQFKNASSTPEVDLGSSLYTPGGVSPFATRAAGADLPDLTPGETYRYRLVATNNTPGNPVAHGTERTVIAPMPAPAEPAAGCANESLRTGASAALPLCRAYELVTPAEKEGATDIYKISTPHPETTKLGLDGESVMVEGAGLQWGASPDPLRSTYTFSRDSEAGWPMTSARPVSEVGGVAYGQVSVWTPDFTRLGFDEVGWGGFGVQSKNVELRVGPPGGPYVAVATIPRAKRGDSRFVAVSADGSNYLVSSNDRSLVLAHPSKTISGDDVYEYSGGELRQANVLSGGAPISNCGAQLAESAADSISEDGSRVLFTDNCTHHLYMRVNGVQTVDIGAYSLFAADAHDEKLLLARGTGAAEEVFLYDTDTSAATLLPGARQGAVVVSKDLSTLYFTSTEALTPDAPALVASSELAQQVTEKKGNGIMENYYRYDVGAKELRFLFQAAADGGRTFASADGRYLFFSGVRVAGEPVGGIETGVRVYRYDGAANAVQCLNCASSFNSDPRLGAYFAGETQITVGSEVLSASVDGEHVFFHTPAALLPSDVDGELETSNDIGSEYFNANGESPSSDVYEWRPNGVAGCVHVQGCLALITSGRGGLNILIGTDTSGRDVFFGTHEALVSQDTDTAGDLYDARVAGGFAPPARGPVECEGAACSTPASAPIDQSPSSLTFSGAGNVRAQAPPPARLVKPKPKPRKKASKHKSPKGRRGHKARARKTAAHHGRRG